MNQRSPLYTEIIGRIDKVRRKENRLALLYGVLTELLFLVILFFTVVIVEEVLRLGITGRTAMFLGAVLTVAGSTSWFVIRPSLRIIGVLKSESIASLAVKIGDHFPAVRDRLIDALQMYEKREALKEHYSIELIDASFQDLYEQIQPLDFTTIVSRSRVKRMGRIVSYAGVLFVLLFVISPSSFLDSAHRILRFNQSFAMPLPIQFIVEPGDVEVVRGQDVPLTIRTSGRPVRSLSLQTRQEGQLEFDGIGLKPDNDGTFHYKMNNIKISTDYFASSEEVKSDLFKIKVLDRPLIRSLQVKTTPPSYTRIPPKTLDENTGDVTAYPGTRVNIQLRSSKELSSAAAFFSDSMKLPLTTIHTDANGTFTVRKNLAYRLLLKDNNELPNIDPIEYAVKVIPDEYPTAEILLPGKNVDLTEDMRLDLFIRLKDDFGFTKLRLAFRMAHSRYEQPTEGFSFIEIPLHAKDLGTEDVMYRWDLSALHLVPEDAIAYYAEVFDNDDVNGPKSGKSETYVVRLPSIEEVFSDVSQTHQQSLESMQTVAKETEQLKKDIEDLQREIKKSREKMDWQQQKKAGEMMQRYESMKQRLQETSKKIDEMMKQMEQNRMLSNETLEKYLELQKLMEKLNSPELQEALKKLQESMKQISPDQFRQSMEQLKFSEEMFRKSLERTIELLKRIHIEQKIDEIIKRVEELKKEQETLREQASHADPSDQQKRENLAQQQRDMQKQAESLGKEAADLREKMEEFPKEMPLEEYSQAQQELEQSDLPEQMMHSAQQMQSGNMQSAQQNQKKSEQNLQKFGNRMRQVQKSLRDKQMQMIVNEMRKQLQNTLELSKREEDLKNETQSFDPNSQRFRESAQQQMEVVNDLGNVANAMTEIAKKTFAVSPEMAKELGNALKQMGDAMQNMEGRNPVGTSQQQNAAMGSLNRAAMLMQGALNGLMQGGQQGMGMAGLMGQLGQMIGAQGGINSGTQQAMGTGEGQGQVLTPQQMAEYQRLAGQQAAVQKSLEQLANEAKNTGEYSRLLGDLDRVVQEMSEVQTDLQQGNVNPETIKKQERILSRLLDSERSLRERDYEKRRRAEAGNNVMRTSPVDINLSTQEGRNRLRQELLKVLEGKYSKDYEELIRRYFEQLEKDEIKQ